MRQLKKSKILGKILTSGLCMVLAVSTLFSTLVVFAQAETKEANLATDELNQTEEISNTIVSYQEVFEYYYNKLISNSTVEIDKDDFIDLYYAQEKPINEFVDFIVETGVHNLEDDTLHVQEQTNVEEGIQTTASGVLQIISPDENYILGSDIGSQNYTESVYFRRLPICEAFDYDRLYDGDIIYESASNSPTKHAAFLYRHDQPYSEGEYAQTIEAVAGGVQYGFLDDERITRFGVSIYRIYRVTDEQISQAKDFVLAQVKKDYSFDFTKTNTDRNSSAWYCSELVYAAYHNAGLEICNNSDFIFEPEKMACLPIYLTQGAMCVSIPLGYNHLQIGVNSFNNDLWNSAYWKINIVNNNSKDVVVAYNSKMCNLEDAKNWSSALSDIKTITIKANSYEVVNICQNFFATAVAVSFVSGTTRYVSYGSELSKTSYMMSVSYNTIQLIQN